MESISNTNKNHDDGDTFFPRIILKIALKEKDDTILENILIITMLLHSNPSKQIHAQRRRSGVNNVVLVPLLLTMNIFHIFSNVSIVDFKQVNIC